MPTYRGRTDATPSFNKNHQGVFTAQGAPSMQNASITKQGSIMSNGTQSLVDMDNISVIPPDAVQNSKAQDFATTLRNSQMRVIKILPANWDYGTTFTPQQTITFPLNINSGKETDGGIFAINMALTELYMEIGPVFSSGFATGWYDANKFLSHEAGAQCFIEKMTLTRNKVPSTFIQDFKRLASLFLWAMLPIYQDYYFDFQTVCEMGLANHTYGYVCSGVSRYDDENIARSNYFNQFIRASHNTQDGDSAYTNTFPDGQMHGYQSFMHKASPAIYATAPVFKIPLMPFEELWNQKNLSFYDVRAGNQLSLDILLELTRKEYVLLSNDAAMLAAMSYKVYNPQMLAPAYYTNNYALLQPSVELQIFRTWIQDQQEIAAGTKRHIERTFRIETTRALAIFFLWVKKTRVEPTTLASLMDVSTAAKYADAFNKYGEYAFDGPPSSRVKIEIGDNNAWPYVVKDGTVEDISRLSEQYFNLCPPRGIPTDLNRYLFEDRGVWAIVLNGISQYDNKTVCPISTEISGIKMTIDMDPDSDYSSIANDQIVFCYVQCLAETKGTLTRGWVIDTA